MPRLVLDIDATIVITHSEKEQATATFLVHRPRPHAPISDMVTNLHDAATAVHHPDTALNGFS